jgi:hypothetical protein
LTFFQDPSLLRFQQRMEDEAHVNNLKTLVHPESIMREIMDGVDPDEVTPLFFRKNVRPRRFT